MTLSRITNDQLQELRRALISTLTGTVVEIGAGRGENLPFLPASADWIGIEPSRSARDELAARATAFGRAEPHDARAEALPMPDDSADVVLATQVWCSIDDPARAMAETRRVLRSGGMLVFVEHVLAPPGTMTRVAQRVMTPLTIALDHNCHLDRDPIEAAAAAGFEPLHVDRYEVTGRIPGLAVPFAIYQGINPGRQSLHPGSVNSRSTQLASVSYDPTITRTWPGRDPRPPSGSSSRNPGASPNREPP